MTTTVTLGTRPLAWPGPDLGELDDATSDRNDIPALRQRLDRDGYLLLRGLHDRAEVLAARRDMQETLDRGSDHHALTNLPTLRRVVDGARVFALFHDLLGGEIRTYDFKWMRVVGTGGFTGAHLDQVYMGRGTHEVYTLWTPFGDYEPRQGTLAVVPGSHHDAGYARVRDTYGNMDVDRDHVQGWFDNDPLAVTGRFGGRWATAAFRAGDALIFGMHLMHMSTVNETDARRLSSDTRYQRADAAVDERWVGPDPKGHYAWNTPGKNVSMAAARAAWGL